MHKGHFCCARICGLCGLPSDISLLPRQKSVSSYDFGVVDGDRDTAELIDHMAVIAGIIHTKKENVKIYG